jgi:hypothetical protein
VGQQRITVLGIAIGNYARKTQQEKAMTRWLFGLLACLAAFSAHAGILYKWEATCIERYFLDEYGGKLVLSCNQPIRGSLLMPDGYIPGTYYDFPEQELPPPTLKIFDTRFGTIQIADAESVQVQLPAESGPGTVGWLWPAGHINFPGHSALELTVPSSYVIVTSDAYFNRIPEPGTLFLASLALGIVALRRTHRTPVA